jgi:plastocyanin
MRIRHTALLAFIPLAVVACGDSDSSAPDEDTETTLEPVDYTDETGESMVEVDATDNRFTEQYIEVTAGTEVEFVNEGENDHNVLPVNEGDFDAIDTADFEPGDSGAITFDEAGEFAYYCSLHGTKTKGMVGRVKVVE